MGRMKIAYAISSPLWVAVISSPFSNYKFIITFYQGEVDYLMNITEEYIWKNIKMIDLEKKQFKRGFIEEMEL